MSKIRNQISEVDEIWVVDQKGTWYEDRQFLNTNKKIIVFNSFSEINFRNIDKNKLPFLFIFLPKIIKNRVMPHEASCEKIQVLNRCGVEILVISPIPRVRHRFQKIARVISVSDFRNGGIAY